MQLDAIVVGTGPGGATVARELALGGARVLILEWGGGEPFDGSQSQALGMIGMPGKNFMLTPQGMIVGRATTVGGSSALYCATAFDPPLEMMARHGVDLAQSAEEAKRDLPYGKLNESLVGPQTRLLTKSALELGYDWQGINKLIFQDKCRLDCYKCYTGCPHGAKWTGRNFALEAQGLGAVLLTRAKAKRVLLHRDRAVGVAFSIYGSDHKAYAPLVIISAGGLGTPAILRRSGISQAGRDFFVDPLVMAWGVVDGFPGIGETPMAAGMHLKDEGIMLTDLSTHPTVYRSFAAQMMRFRDVPRHKNALGVMVKIRDDLGGRLTDRGGIWKFMGRPDWDRLAKGYGHARRILKNAGADRIFKSWYIAGHPGGTAKIGDVVDANLMTAKENLYVCDCSVIPEAWGVPPSLTLVSLGKRLARHLCS